MSCEVAISLLLCTASLQPGSAGGWGSPGGPSSPFGAPRVGFFSGQLLTSLGGGLGWAPGRSDHPDQEGGLRKAAASGGM